MTPITTHATRANAAGGLLAMLRRLAWKEWRENWVVLVGGL